MSNVVNMFPVKEPVKVDEKYTLAAFDIVTLDSLDSRLSKAKNAYDYCRIANEIAKDLQAVFQYHNIKV